MENHPFRVYAHRGSSASVPENTIEGFAQALRDGADALETDLHRTRDGHLVVSHDADGRRMAGVAEKIADCTLAEVRQWDAGAGFVTCDGSKPFSGNGFRVPTLDQVLQAFPHVPISIDLKPDEPELVPGLLATIARHMSESRVTIGSFHRRIVDRVRHLGYPGTTTLTQPEVALLRLLIPVPLRLLRRRFRRCSAQIPLRAYGVRLDARNFIRRCRRAGLRVDYWVVNDTATAVQLHARGATGVMTDDPASIVSALKELGGQPRSLRNRGFSPPGADDEPAANARSSRHAPHPEA